VVAAPKGNKYAVGNNGGRPLKYKCVEDMQVVIDKYFIDMADEGRPLTISGLAYALEIDRDQLLDYAKRDEFSSSLLKARHRVYVYAEESLWTCKNPAGPIFNLKNNYGWQDRQDINVNMTGGYAERLQAAEERSKLVNVTPIPPEITD